MTVLLLALHIPGCDGTEDADMVADNLVAIINEERKRNGGAAYYRPVTIDGLAPTPQWATPEQQKQLLRAIRLVSGHEYDAEEKRLSGHADPPRHTCVDRHINALGPECLEVRPTPAGPTGADTGT